jgi:predicted AAA+ superfamily ATPase
MLSDDELKEILVRQRAVIQNKDYGIERTVLKDLAPRVRMPHVIVLTGLRRSGKSTLLRQIMREYYHDSDFYYINFEDERLFDFPASDFNRLYEVLVSLYGKQKTFFLDEIQNVDRFEIFVRRFYEEGFKFFITGSSAALLSKEIGTKLTGRHLDTKVNPFSFLEFLDLKGLKLNKESMYLTEAKASIRGYFEEYLIKGGMPEYLIFNNQEILGQVYNDIVIKDIAARHKIENITVLRQLYLYLISNFASKFSYNSIKKFTTIKSVNTIKKFIGYLEDTYFGTTISKFDYSYKKQLINDKKFYVLDNGFIDILSRTFSTDKGRLLENLVFVNLNLEGEVFYYYNVNECDFLLTKNKKVKQAVQVCYDLNEKNREREFKGLLAALKEFDLAEGLILTSSQSEEVEIDGKRISIKPVWKWLLEKTDKVI